MSSDNDVDIDAIMADLESDSTSIEPITDIAKEIEEEAEKEIVVIESKEVAEIDLEEENALANRIVANSIDVIKSAKEVYTTFSDDVFHGKDRSTSSKEAMLKALDVQNSANKNMIDMAKVLKDKGTGNGANILINTVSEKQAGISISNIKDSL